MLLGLLAPLAESGRTPDPGELGEQLGRLPGRFAAIVESPRWLLGLVDATRSYPLFYTEEAPRILSNSARALREAAGLDQADERGLLEFRTAGYVTGRGTVVRGLHQLRPGELLLHRPGEPSAELHRYYRYLPTAEELPEATSEAGLETQLDQVTDLVISRLVEELGGRPVCLLLSGGLDSRFLLLKLRQHGCQHLTTLTFGQRDTIEVRLAREVARAMEVPWLFVPSSRPRARRLFWSRTRRDYWREADGLCSLPGMGMFETLATLRSEERLPPGVVLLSGQTGDFITGGHIPARLLEPCADLRILLDVICAKHFCLWRQLWTPENRRRIEDGALEVMQLHRDQALSPGELAARYELWEWQERQCKYVINEQRICDFLEIDWRLPLWEMAFMEFWRQVPVKLRAGSKLYRSYLASLGPVFSSIPRTRTRQPGPALLMNPLMSAIRLICGPAAARDLYQYMRYVGIHRTHYGIFGLRMHARTCRQAEKIESLYVDVWLRENGFPPIIDP